MILDFLPSIEWEGKIPKQIYVPVGNAKPIREELYDLINNIDSDIRNWARSIIEPFEICYISETEEDSDFKNWKLITPWMCVDETEQIIYDRIFSTDVPEESVIIKIVISLRKWPSWLPIPLETDGNTEWMSDEDAKEVVIIQSSGNDNSLLSCDLSKAMFKEAKKSGMKLYNLVKGFEELLPNNRKIRGLSIEESGESKIYQLSINHLNESGNLERIYDLLKQHGQTNAKLWPIFVEDDKENILMVSEPEGKWSSTFLCLSDNFTPNKNKSLWSFNWRNKSFSPIGGDPHGKITPNYIINLKDEFVKYTHLVSVDEGGKQIFDGYNFIIKDIKQDIKFSDNKYHFSDTIKEGTNLGPKTWFSLGIYSHLDNTSTETKQLFDRCLPPLPNILHSLKMPSEFNKSISPPDMKGVRRDLGARFSLNEYGAGGLEQEGFARHVFNISSSTTDVNRNNNNYKDSVNELTKLERAVYDFQKKTTINDEDEYNEAWQKCQEEMEKNWSFIFRIYTPALAILEDMIVDDSFDKRRQQLMFTLASLEGLKNNRFSPLNKGRNRNFQIWFAYITESKDKKQRLQIEIAKSTTQNQAKGKLNQNIFLSNDIFSEYRNRPGFYTSESLIILDNELLHNNQFAEDHIRNFWNASNNRENQGGLLKIILNINDGVELPISWIKTTAFQETLGERGKELTELEKELNNNGIEFLFEKQFLDENPEIEENIFSWIFNPYSSTGDTIISKLTYLSNDNPKISLLVEAIWNRLNEKYSEYAPQLLKKLGDWCIGIDKISWKEYVSKEFYENIISASQGRMRESLYSKLVKSENEDQVFNALQSESFERSRLFTMPSIWTNKMRGIYKDKLFVTDRKSLFGEYYPSAEVDVVSTGYGLNMNVKWYPLSQQEWIEYNKLPITNENDSLRKKIIQHWGTIFEECFTKTVELSENASDLMIRNEKEEIGIEGEERHLFLANRVAWLLLGMYTKKKTPSLPNKNYFIKSLPLVEIKRESGTHKINSKINKHVTLGPSGWDLDYDSETHRLSFKTSKPISKELMEKKVKRLKEILQAVTLELGGDIWDNDYRLRKVDFESEFEIELDNTFPLCKIDPISNFESWYENYSNDLVEPDQDFIDIYELGDWRDSNKAAKILDTFTTTDIPKWLESPSEMGKIELEIMYPSSLQCTLPDYRIYTDIGPMSEIPLSRVRLHSGDPNYGKSVVGVLENNRDREEKVGKNVTHIGNTLLVSAHAQRRGSRNDGWRLTGKEGFSNFLEYLENNWEDLFNQYNDCDNILIKEVVKTPDTDLEFDILGDLVLHKLHILYIIGFYKATKRSDE